MSRPSETIAFSVGRKTARGSVTMASRQITLLAISFGTGIVLARYLTAAEFGAYALVLFLANFGRVLVDGGLAASLLRQANKPTKRELDAVFTVQSIAAMAVCAALMVTGLMLSRFYSGAERIELTVVIGVLALVPTPLIAISVATLERELDFRRLSNLITLQPLLFSTLAIIFTVWQGSTLALSSALLISNLIQAPVALAVSGYRPHFYLSRITLSGRLSFALPILGVSIISSIKDAVNPAFIGLVAGAGAVGYVNWAQQVAILGMYLVVAVSRLLFPAFARLTQEREALARSVSVCVYWANTAVAAPTVFIFLYADALVPMVYGERWEPAIPLLRLLLASNLVSASAAVLLALMNAMGKPRISLAFALIWFRGTWTLVPPLVSSFGFIGYGYANAIIQVTTLLLFAVARRQLEFAFVREAIAPWALAIFAFIIVHTTVRSIDFDVDSIFRTLAVGVLSTSIMVALILIFSRKRVLTLRRSLQS